MEVSPPSSGNRDKHKGRPSDTKSELPSAMRGSARRPLTFAHSPIEIPRILARSTIRRPESLATAGLFTRIRTPLANISGAGTSSDVTMLEPAGCPLATGQARQ
jgi:hypothetical protein